MILEKGTGNGTAANPAGEFKLMISGFPANIIIQCLGFRDTVFVISNESVFNKDYKDRKIIFYLTESVTNIQEVEIKAHRILFEKEPYSIIDYQFFRNRIVSLAYINGNSLRPQILLSDFNGKIVDKKQVPSPDQIYKDCQGNVFIITKDWAYQLQYHKNSIAIADTIAAAFFEKNLRPVVAVTDSTIIIKSESPQRQYENFFAILDSSTAKIIWTVGNYRKEAGAIGMNLSAKMQARQFVKFTPSEDGFLWFFDMEAYERMYHDFFRTILDKTIDFPYVYSRMFQFGNAVILFDRGANEIVWFSPSGNVAKEVTIEKDPLAKGFTNAYLDEPAKKFYLEYQDGPVSWFVEINPKTGERLKRIPGNTYPHMEQCNFHNGKLYFLYQPINGLKIKKLNALAI